MIRVIPARGPITIAPEQLGAALEERTNRLRVQTLDFYKAPSNEEQHDRYAAGEPFEMTEYKAAWLAELGHSSGLRTHPATPDHHPRPRLSSANALTRPPAGRGHT